MAETADARWANRSSVLAALLAGGGRSRPELSRETGLSAATVSRVVEGLLDEGLVREGSPLQTGRRGRQAVLLEVASERGIACGVDLGGTSCRFLVTDLLGGAPRYVVEPTPGELGAHEFADWLSGRVQALVAEGGRGADRRRSVVVGLPGAVSSDGLTVRGATNLPKIEGEEFTRRLRRNLDGAVGFDNDANLALEGELRYGAARSAETAVMFTIGRGFGAGVALDRRVIGGRTGLVGEFGFLPVGADGQTVERLVSAEGLMRAARDCGAPGASAEEVFHSSDPQLRAVLNSFEQALGVALIAVTLAYEPDLVVLGGRVSESIDAALLSRIRDQVHGQLPKCPELVSPELGDRAGSIGAVARALTVLHTRFDVDPATAAGLDSELDVAALLASHP